VLQQTQAQVCLDLTHPDSVYDNVLAAIACGARPVIGTTGLSQPQLSTLHHTLLQQASGGLYIPNFSIGAVLMMKFAAQAAQYFDHVELVELHHHHKADAPSGTAMMTAQLIAQQQVGKPFNLPQVKEPEHLPGARGAVTDNGIRIHSVRLPGLLAHQEIMFGAAGQLLTLRHDAFDRQCYMPGVLLACQKVLSQMGLVQGLDAIL
jgi:4-hydroxy-tetrahydrodipicolinate reductase